MGKKAHSGLASFHILISKNGGRNAMTEEKVETQDKQNENCISVFKNGALTKEIYTRVWIELISNLERRKSVNFSLCQ
jgi:hypothetical protein